MTWEEIKKLSREKAIDLLIAYSNYVIDGIERGIEPVCVAEFYDNDYIWDYCFNCGTPLTIDMVEDTDWFDIHNSGEAFPLCRECNEKAEKGELEG